MNEPYKILLVDDEAEVRTSIIRKIDWSAVGFQVVGDAENGADALEKIEQLEPDVVLTIFVCPIWMVWKWQKDCGKSTRP